MRRSLAVILITLATVGALTTIATAQTYTDLYNLDPGHGFAHPAVLAQARDGHLYGTTFSGGPENRGVVFDFQPIGKFKQLYSFTKHGTPGYYPYSGLTLGTDGSLYGATSQGGENFFGTLFKFAPGQSGTILYSFGSISAAPPIEGIDGSFYGTFGSEPGAVYKFSSAGTFTQLVSIPAGATQSPLLQATDGNFYGMNGAGGSYGNGIVFRVAPVTPKGVLTVIHNFEGTEGAIPIAALIQGSDGNLYGTTNEGGAYGEGVAFRLTLNGSLTVLHNFGDPSYPGDGQNPVAALLQATDGNFYGVSPNGGSLGYGGIFFRITLDGTYSILYNFDQDGGLTPYATPVQHTDGKIYGVTSLGGTMNGGVIYSFDLGLNPFVRPVLPSGEIGQTSGMLGQGFTGTTNVSFNGTPAKFVVKSDTYLTATVPNGATTGYITVTTPSGTLISNQEFLVRP